MISKTSDQMNNSILPQTKLGQEETNWASLVADIQARHYQRSSDPFRGVRMELTRATGKLIERVLYWQREAAQNGA